MQIFVMQNKSEIDLKLVFISRHENYTFASSNTENLEGISVKQSVFISTMTCVPQLQHVNFFTD
jgi:hypothetical protein